MSHDWQSILDEYYERLKTARAMGPENKLENQRTHGLDARQRLDCLVDENSFCEIGTLVGGLGDNGVTTPADGIVGGLATIDGRPVVVAAEDFTVLGGSIGFGNHAKRLRFATIALQERIPFVILLEGAGERATNAMHRHPYAPNDLQVLAQLKGQVPTVALVMGASAGHGALSGVLMDFIIMTDNAALFSAGPPLVEAALGEKVDKEDLGGAKIHTQKSGVAHNRVATDAQAFALARDYLSYMPSNDSESPPSPKTTVRQDDSRIEEILELVPRDVDRPYDMKAVVVCIVDDGEFLELQPEFGGSMLTGLARLGGHACGIVANQPMVLAGAINRAAADKATRFLRVAGDFGLPVVFLADNPGVLPGTAAEAEGTLLAAANMFMAQSRLRSPKLHVTLRKAFGFGSSVMAMNPFDRQTLTLAFPGATLGGIPATSGADAAALDADAKAALQKAEAAACWRSADTMAYDEIIDPRELRNYLVTGLNARQGSLKQ
jgi:acetyl-CoA carboxylase carboxyltransferase component